MTSPTARAPRSAPLWRKVAPLVWVSGCYSIHKEITRDRVFYRIRVDSMLHVGDAPSSSPGQGTRARQARATHRVHVRGEQVSRVPGARRRYRITVNVLVSVHSNTHHSLGLGIAIPMHYGTFPLGFEPLHEPPQRFLPQHVRTGSRRKCS